MGGLGGLPIGIADSLANIPERMQMPILFSILPIMGAYADGVQVRYVDGKVMPLALMSIIVGEMASGKSNCKEIVDVWRERMQEEDARQRKIEDEWKQQRKTKKANEKGKPDPQVTIREVPVTISCSTILRRFKNSRGHCLYSFGEELDTLRKTNGAGSWSSKYDIYRMGFDHGEWGQDYNSDQAESGIVRVAYNWTILGTYGAFRKCFKAENIENGLSSRIMLAEMPDNRYKPITTYEPITEEARAHIRQAVDRLSSASGTLTLPRLTEAIAKWLETQRLEALKNDDLLRDTFRKRAAVIGFRSAAIYHLLEGKEGETTVSDQCISFGTMVAAHVLEEQMRLFGKSFAEASEGNSRSDYGTQNQQLLDRLPQEFTHGDLRQLRGTQTPPSTISTILRRWAENGLVEKNSRGSWTKI